MKICCAVGCAKPASHAFPRDPGLLKRWCIAINRVTDKKKLWYPSPSSRLCSAHFVPEDFAIPMIPCGDEHRKRLRPGVVPTVFMHKSRPSKESMARDERRKLRQQRLDPTRLAKRKSEAEISPDSFFNNHDEVQVEVMTENIEEPTEKGCQTNITLTSEMDTQTEENLNLRFGILAYKNNPNSIQYFTGFLDYDHFCYFFFMSWSCRHATSNTIQEIVAER